ncbi:MAG TPA: class I SAM-dependent methyltransferase [Xanthobacteraceae bacterium]|jgi:ubiquinone/menaquinone biosynthesis C-methylase UbiE|nr:class I SAM-dependent methyltransferase [Xanthobacteraceae bacterium]
MPAASANMKPYRGMAMEGPVASWYARNTASSAGEFAELARRVAAELTPGAAVLEIAPGPGYLAIELARRGPWQVTGLDISHSFVRIASENAARAGVAVSFRHGNAAAQPFAPCSFDFIVCRAAFKNFADPIGALTEMHRVLLPRGTALIIDMRKDATDAAVDDQVSRMGLGTLSRWMTRMILKSLRRRAYSGQDFERMIAASPFGRGEINAAPLGFEVRLMKETDAVAAAS